MAEEADAGEMLHAFWLVLPAAATAMSPLAERASTASLTEGDMLEPRDRWTMTRREAEIDA